MDIKVGLQMDNIYGSASIWGAIFYLVYTAFYPTDSFYYEEFERVTLRKPPASSVIKRKEASYPSVHGEYCSSALMELSTTDYQQLLKEISTDKRFFKGQYESWDEIENVRGNLPQRSIVKEFQRAIKGEEDHYLYIGFFNDGRTIIVNLCVT